MNYIEKVREMLQLEVGETFWIIGEIACKAAHYWFTNDGLHSDNNDIIIPEVLGKIILGDYKVIRCAWKPKNAEIVYSAFRYPTNRIESFVFNDNNPIDLSLYINGVVYKTYEEAYDNYNADLTKYMDPIRKEYRKR